MLTYAPSSRSLTATLFLFATSITPSPSSSLYITPAPMPAGLSCQPCPWPPIAPSPSFRFFLFRPLIGLLFCSLCSNFLTSLILLWISASNVSILFISELRTLSMALEVAIGPSVPLVMVSCLWRSWWPMLTSRSSWSRLLDGSKSC